MEESKEIVGKGRVNEKFTKRGIKYSNETNMEKRIEKDKYWCKEEMNNCKWETIISNKSARNIIEVINEKEEYREKAVEEKYMDGDNEIKDYNKAMKMDKYARKKEGQPRRSLENKRQNKKR